MKKITVGFYVSHSQKIESFLQKLRKKALMLILSFEKKWQFKK